MASFILLCVFVYLAAVRRICEGYTMQFYPFRSFVYIDTIKYGRLDYFCLYNLTNVALSLFIQYLQGVSAETNY